MEKTLKYSKQREALLRILCGVNTHPTADRLYEEIRKEFPKISLATVYRNLNQLVENGEIIRLECNGEAEHYDGNPKKHYHFICRKCTAIIDVSISDACKINDLVIEKDMLKVEDHELFFYGLCQNCM